MAQPEGGPSFRSLGDIPKFIGGASNSVVRSAMPPDAASCSSSFRIKEAHHGCGIISSPGCSNASEGPWVWRVSNLPHVPLHVPLERTSLQLPGVPAEVISKRISDFMRINSIVCTYHTESGRVDCLTDCYLKFVVQLWQGDEEADLIIMEVQRRRGCAVAMKFLRRELFRSVMSTEASKSTCQAHRSRVHQRPSPIVGNGIEGRKQKCSSSQGALSLCLDLVESECKDQNKLGLESLNDLTDSTKVCKDDAEEVARALIYNEGKHGPRLRQALVTFFWKLEGHDSGFLSEDSSYGYDDTHSLEYQQCCHCAVTHLLALKVLSNCLDSIASLEEDYLSNEVTMLGLTCKFWQDIMNTLIYHIEMASHRPQEAALSVKCLRILESLEPDVLTPLFEEVVIPLLRPALEFGRSHHLLLERECQKLLQYLEDNSEGCGGYEQIDAE